MLFWVIMLALLAVSAFLIFQCVLAVKGRYGDGGYGDGRYGDGGYGDDGYGSEDYERPRRRREPDGRGRPVKQREDHDYDEPLDSKREAHKPARRQWRILMENLDTRERYTYQFYDTIGIGRAKDDPEFEYFLTVEGDPKVSKHHCAIVCEGGKLYLQDLGSTNGTFLNEDRLGDIVLLQKEDVIRIGETQIEVLKILRERE